MKKYLIGIFVFLFLTIICSQFSIFAHQAIDVDGSIKISGLNEKITEALSGKVDISQWEHGETNGNFMEAIFTFTFSSEITECGNLMEEGTVTVSAHRKNKYNIESRRFPLGLKEEGMSDLIKRILNKHDKTVQESLGTDKCMSITVDGVSTESGKTISLTDVYVSRCRAVITASSVKIHFSAKSGIIASDKDYSNRRKHPMKIYGKLVIPREEADHH